ncbi:nucleoside hydrolase [Enterococcus faecalis]|jgi:pyrimidine-specific ribonucleoside hydrolase|uniref:Cytidine/uridine-specific hydrolase n=2 Tax=Enterococcus TaxID=1350 RepID=A0ABC9THS0_ENTFL|nr:nucleoside hydrolase [Enterococcus faecalis]EPI04872.1 putative cytidine/uridine-specific hydrolase [Enterococcus faecalis RP2S-4]EPI27215.1 putative cytidine/uridine-specific hydrolase [Enterococcus faecalis VC1B-1]EHQ2579357.1 nucleoside hydrolase [Enterococcus faecalis]EHQ8812136.1 nucleoside hydrolase [Enterococcus faecalis]
MKMKQLWIDCDPGHDDALAILTALAHPESVNIIGISTIGGNQTLEKVTRNAQNILAFVNAKIPLVKGAAGPLVKPLNAAPEAHGDSGMDGPFFKENNYPIIEQSAISYMYKQLINLEQSATIIALGPLTNIALLLKAYPEIKEKIECISLMGGGLSHGNSTPLAEFNIFVDPEAAQIVFQSEIPIIMAGLDVTEKAEIQLSEIDKLKGRGVVSQLAYELLHFYNQSGRQFGFINSPLHDLCAVAYLLKPELFQGEYKAVNVITDDGQARGLTYVDKRRAAYDKPNALVLTEVQREKFVRLFVEALNYLDNLET